MINYNSFAFDIKLYIGNCREIPDRSSLNNLNENENLVTVSLENNEGVF